jgi:hypothetical protein
VHVPVVLCRLVDLLVDLCCLVELIGTDRTRFGSAVAAAWFLIPTSEPVKSL